MRNAWLLAHWQLGQGWFIGTDRDDSLGSLSRDRICSNGSDIFLTGTGRHAIGPTFFM